MLERPQVRYNTWGELNAAGDNCVVVCHALTGNASLDDDVLKGAVGELAAIDRDGPRASFQVPPDWRGASIDDWKPPGAVCDVSFRGRVRRGVVEAYTVCEAIVKLDKVAALLPLSLARDAGRVSWVDDA